MQVNVKVKAGSTIMCYMDDISRPIVHIALAVSQNKITVAEYLSRNGVATITAEVENGRTKYYYDYFTLDGLIFAQRLRIARLADEDNDSIPEGYFIEIIRQPGN